MNQLSHRMPLFSPMILIVSFSRASFSYTTPLMMMATEYIHAKVMKRGIDLLITRRKLEENGQSYHCSVWSKVEFVHPKVHSHVIHVARVGHLLKVHADLVRGAGDSSDDSMLDDVLQVGKSAPYIPQVLEGVCSGTRVPIAGEQDQNWLKRMVKSFYDKQVSVWTRPLTRL